MSIAHAREFLFVTCQVGAEGAVKSEIARLWPAFRFAYSRPGFLTFKVPQEEPIADDFDLGAVFARTSGFVLGKVTGATDEELARAGWERAAGLPAARLHVWPRDLRAPGDHGYEPGFTEASVAARAALVAAAPAWAQQLATADAIAQPGEQVLDCVLVSPGEWWFGYHQARAGASCLPGGYVEIKLPADVVSRAYLKTVEGLRWSGLPLQPGDECVELGCAPGGSCQLLLSRGLKMTGVDPAAMHESVLAHPNFTHLRKRAADVRRREFRKTRWLLADINVAPEYTLDAVEAIVTHPEVRITGLLLTLKLLDWELADQLPQYLERIRSWGYPQVAARQLHHSRQEVCVAASKPPSQKRRGGRSSARRTRR